MFFRNGLKVNLNIFYKILNILLWTVIIIGSILIIFKSSAYSQAGNVDVFHNNKHQFSLTYEEFSLILKSANIYQKLIDAEHNDRVIIRLKDNPWNLKNQNYITEAYIVWLDKDNKEIKKITISIELSPDNYPSFGNKYYSTISSIGFPIMSILVFLLILL